MSKEVQVRGGAAVQKGCAGSQGLHRKPSPLWPAPLHQFKRTWRSGFRTGSLSAPSVEKSASAQDQNDHDDDQEGVGVHESCMLAEHMNWIERRRSNLRANHST